MPLANMVNKIGSIKSADDVNALKSEMDKFMEKELKVNMDDYKENLEKLERQLDEAKMKNQVVEEVDEHEHEHDLD
jgi:hypothetical protein